MFYNFYKNTGPNISKQASWKKFLGWVAHCFKSYMHFSATLCK